MLSKKRREEIDNEFAKVFGADFVKKVNEAPEEKVCCFFALSEGDILKAINEEAVVIKHPNFGLEVSADNRREFIKEVVDKFKGSFFVMTKDWEEELRGCVKAVIEDWTYGK